MIPLFLVAPYLLTSARNFSYRTRLLAGAPFAFPHRQLKCAVAEYEHRLRIGF